MTSLKRCGLSCSREPLRRLRRSATATRGSESTTFVFPASDLQLWLQLMAHQLYRSRRLALKRLNSPQLALLQRVGVEGMSSDESSGESPEDDFDHGRSKIVRVSPAWRSAPFERWQHSLDPMIRDLRSGQVGTQYNFRRQVSGRVNPSAIVPCGLPRNCYNDVRSSSGFHRHSLTSHRHGSLPCFLPR